MRINLRMLLPLALLAGLTYVCGVPRIALAQENPNGSQSQAQQQSTSPGAELAKETREAEGEDENGKLKQSAAVRIVGKLTGLGPHGAYLVCVVFNFAVIVAFILYMGRKSLPGFFRDRTASIQKAMEEAKRASEDANRRLKDVEARLSRLDSEIAELRATGDKEIAAEEERIKAAAAEDARKIVEAASQEIAAAGKAARRELTAFAADLAVKLAAKQIHVDGPTDQALVRNFAQQLAADKGGQKEVR